MDSQVASGLDRERTYRLDGERLMLGLEANGGQYTWRRVTR